MKFSMILFCILLSGCASLLGNRLSEDAQQSQVQKVSDEAELKTMEQQLAQGRYEETLKLAKDFQSRRATSLYFEASRLAEAQAYEGLGHYQEAANLDRDVYLKTIKYQPQIAAQALYRMSFAYEALGDDLKTVAALLDAKKLGEHLPHEVAYAEIPARLAAVYGRQQRENEAIQYLNEAEKGIAYVIEEKGPQVKKDWLAKTYVQMGSVSTNQLSSENFQELAQGQKWVQVYLIKALRLNDPTWSSRAQNKLQETYRDLYTQVESEKDRSQQSSIGGDLVDLLDQADLYRPLSGQKMNSYEQGFFSYISEVRKKLEKLLYGSGETMGLTQESQKLNSLKRAGRVKADSFLPEEKKSSIPLPPKVVPAEDPNL